MLWLINKPYAFLFLMFWACVHTVVNQKMWVAASADHEIVGQKKYWFCGKHIVLR